MQLERSRATYLMMREVGFQKTKAVTLDFAFYPATEDNARALVEYLTTNTKYSASAAKADEHWIVKGSTHRVRLNAASLGRWVHSMCKAGFKFDCLFDGWGTRV